jgi:hypothetical protein
VEARAVYTGDKEQNGEKMNLRKFDYVTWIRTGKTAGTSLDDSLSDIILREPKRGFITEVQSDKVGEWYSVAQFKTKYPDIWEKSFKFMVARNPYDRLVSAWRFFHPNSNNNRLNMFVKMPMSRSVAYHVTRPQTAGLIEDGKLNLDFVVRFENLQESFDELCDVLGIEHIMLPHLRRSEHKHFSNYYNDHFASYVYNLFADDFKYLGYERDSWL